MAKAPQNRKAARRKTRSEIAIRIFPRGE